MKEDIWQLKDIIGYIREKILEKTKIEIKEVYLFGSRAYKTGSLVSDIDLLVVADRPFPANINEEIHAVYPCVDLFLTTDYKLAHSIMNGSVICFNEGKWAYKDIIDQLDAILLWSSGNGFSTSFDDWEQRSAIGVDFSMSIIPSNVTAVGNVDVNKYIQKLKKEGIITYYAGGSIGEITESIIKIVRNTFNIPSTYQKRAENFSFNKIKIENEYDFQNLIQFMLKPIFYDIESEPFMVKFDGNEKYADFALCNNKIVIEAKWINSESKEAEVLKTIEGLGDFYKKNPQIESLVFLLLYEKNMVFDKNKIEEKFTKKYEQCEVIVACIKNTFSE